MRIHLIGEADEKTGYIEVHVPVVAVADDVRRLREMLVRHVSEDGDKYGEVVTVRLDEVMPRDGRRVDVVFAEWPDERLKHSSHVMDVGSTWCSWDGRMNACNTSKKARLGHHCRRC